MSVLIASGCSRKAEAPKKAAQNARFPDPMTLALARHEGGGKLDVEIRRLQDQVRAGRNTEPALERLGWSFVAKARQSFDPGFYRLAEACALCMEARRPQCPEALLLRGHVLHNLHRFKEAEPLARQLVTGRGLPFDFGLLGDVLMEQGKLDPAVEAYQRMVDLRPDLHSYARGAHIRWLKGNLAGAEKLMRMAVTAASPLDPESAAWVHTRLAGYQFQAGAFDDAERTCDLALDYQKDYPPALLLRGRLMLAQGKPAEAGGLLRQAVELNPLPEYQWALAEALRADGHADEAAAVERQVGQKGAATDPRTYSIYLATRGESLDTALSLAEAEMNCRADVFTHDALAWALAASGKLEEARRQMEQALAEGTKDGRLFFHAAIIAHKLGEKEQARQWAQQATHLQQLLLPSERQQLNQAFPPQAAIVARSGNANQKGQTQ